MLAAAPDPPGAPGCNSLADQLALGERVVEQQLELTPEFARQIEKANPPLTERHLEAIIAARERLQLIWSEEDNPMCLGLRRSHTSL